MTRQQYLGTWVLPSGNGADVYLTAGRLDCFWDRAPSPAWPPGDVEHYRAVTWPAILRALCTATGRDVLGVSA